MTIAIRQSLWQNSWMVTVLTALGVDRDATPLVRCLVTGDSLNCLHDIDLSCCHRQKYDAFFSIKQLAGCVRPLAF